MEKRATERVTSRAGSQLGSRAVALSPRKASAKARMATLAGGAGRGGSSTPTPQFWRPGASREGVTGANGGGSSIDRASSKDDSEGGGLTVGSAAPSSNLGIQGQRRRLPVYKQRSQFLYMLEQFPVLVVQGQTGSGKTTQLPQFCMESGWAQDGLVIACTQPRRVAATSVASRVAEEVGTVLGDEVGYTIRFEDLSHPTRTRIKYLTDGMLFRECMLDPLLSKYSVIMVDEAHERSSYTDLLLGLLKKVRRKRPDLRLIISSATIDAEAFARYFNATEGGPSTQEAAILSLEGRMYPVEMAYLEEPSLDYVQSAVQTICDLHLRQPPGDVLAFMTGREEIETCLDLLADRMATLPKGSLALQPMPLHAGLTSEEQMAIFESTPPGARKVVISTNIAEASVTIERIRYVVDSGYVKLRVYNPSSAMDTLRITPTSRASADQRAGRAGRTSSGKCFRLYSEAALATLAPSTPPELCRSDVSLFILQLKSLGIDNVAKFDFMTAPPSHMFERALEYLYSLGALDQHGRLTPDLGLKMAELPVDPAIAKILLESARFGCSEEILSIAAMTSVQSVFLGGEGAAGALSDIERRKFTVEEGDHCTLLNVYNAFVQRGRKSAKWCHAHRLNFKAMSRAVSIRQQLSKYLQRFSIPLKSCGGDTTPIRRCLVSGYFKNAAKFAPDGTYTLLRENTRLHVHPSSVMFTRTPGSGYVVFHDVIETTKMFMRDLTVIEADWLVELSNGYYQS